MGIIFGNGCIDACLMDFKDHYLGLEQVKEEFSLTATGFMMSGYFVGYFIGAKTIPQIISRVGHIRVFAAFASVASLSSFNSRCICKPFCLVFIKSAYGISMVSIYTVAESWLNDRASNKNRGSVLSVYMVILYGAMGLGMFLLNFSDPLNFQPFYIDFRYNFSCTDSNFTHQKKSTDI
jgi:MFS family permease